MAGFDIEAWTERTSALSLAGSAADDRARSGNAGNVPQAAMRTEASAAAKARAIIRT
jgi:hypothetical protein